MWVQTPPGNYIFHSKFSKFAINLQAKNTPVYPYMYSRMWNQSANVELLSLIKQTTCSFDFKGTNRGFDL